MVQIIASWDDANKEDLRLAELCDGYNIYAIFYWPVNWKKINAYKHRSYLDENDMRQIADKFEIGSHTVTHSFLTQIKGEYLDYELEDSKRHFEELFNKKIESLCYPRGYYNDQVKKASKRAGYTNARTTRVGYLGEPSDPFETHTTVHVGYNRKEYGKDTWQKYAHDMLEEAKHREDNGENIIYRLWGHGFEIRENKAWHDLEKLLKDLAQ